MGGRRSPAARAGAGDGRRLPGALRRSAEQRTLHVVPGAAGGRLTLAGRRADPAAVRAARAGGQSAGTTDGRRRRTRLAGRTARPATAVARRGPGCAGRRPARRASRDLRRHRSRLDLHPVLEPAAPPPQPDRRRRGRGSGHRLLDSAAGPAAEDREPTGGDAERLRPGPLPTRRRGGSMARRTSVAPDRLSGRRRYPSSGRPARGGGRPSASPLDLRPGRAQHRCRAPTAAWPAERAPRRTHPVRGRARGAPRLRRRPHPVPAGRTDRLRAPQEVLRVPRGRPAGGRHSAAFAGGDGCPDPARRRSLRPSPRRSRLRWRSPTMPQRSAAGAR